MENEVSAWDASDYLASGEDRAAYLNAVIAEGDPLLLQAALGDIAKAEGMAKVAAEAEVGRESLYKSLSKSGNPSFQTILRVAQALGLRISFVAVAQ